jgi:hypothetical protein
MLCALRGAIQPVRNRIEKIRNVFSNDRLCCGDLLASVGE